MPMFWNDLTKLDTRYARLPLAGGGFGMLNTRLASVSGGVPTVAAGAANTGAGASVVRGFCTDYIGRLTIVAGSTASAGALARVTFSSNPFSSDVNVLVTSMDAATATARPFATVVSSQVFDIGFVSVTPGATYVVSFFAVQMF